VSVYVETLIRGPIDKLWRLTQTPELHERWDLRFTSGMTGTQLVFEQERGHSSMPLT